MSVDDFTVYVDWPCATIRIIDAEYENSGDNIVNNPDWIVGTGGWITGGTDG
jgi:hypothetical protein